jgi:hypothetical protein
VPRPCWQLESQSVDFDTQHDGVPCKGAVVARDDRWIAPRTVPVRPEQPGDQPGLLDLQDADSSHTMKSRSNPSVLYLLVACYVA